MSGRELDALIAEKVMGWTAWRSPSVPRGVTEPDCWRTGERESPTYRMIGWHPSTDVANAWRVVEKLRPAGFGIAVADTPRGYEVTFDHMESGTCAVDEAPTLPLAICRAALAAMEVR